MMPRYGHCLFLKIQISIEKLFCLFPNHVNMKLKYENKINGSPMCLLNQSNAVCKFRRRKHARNFYDNTQTQP